MRRTEALFVNCAFLTSVASPAQLPKDHRPEIAFAGRSNVGKSSLINALAKQRSLAKTSNTPGRTQLLNYFTLGNKAYLVDMPGYGYAKAPKAQVIAWTRLIEAYLRERQNLKRVFLLVDARHGLKESDERTMEFLDRFAVSYQPVLTKLDKVKSSEGEECIAMLEREIKKRPAAFAQVIATSSTSSEGIESLRAAVKQALGI